MFTFTNFLCTIFLKRYRRWGDVYSVITDSVEEKFTKKTFKSRWEQILRVVLNAYVNSLELLLKWLSSITCTLSYRNPALVRTVNKAFLVELERMKSFDQRIIICLRFHLGKPPVVMSQFQVWQTLLVPSISSPSLSFRGISASFLSLSNRFLGMLELPTRVRSAEGLTSPSNKSSSNNWSVRAPQASPRGLNSSCASG